MTGSKAGATGHLPEAELKESKLKHIGTGLATLLLAGVSAIAMAAELKIGFIDQERITRESAPAERACKQLE